MITAFTLNSSPFLALLVIVVTWGLYVAFRRKSVVESLPVPVSCRCNLPASTDTSANPAVNPISRLAQNSSGGMSDRSS